MGLEYTLADFYEGAHLDSKPDAVDDNFGGGSSNNLPALGDSSDRPPSEVKVSSMVKHSGNSSTAQANTLGNGPALTNTYLSPVEAYFKTLPDSERMRLNTIAPVLAKLGVDRPAREIYLTTPALYERVSPEVFACVAKRLAVLGTTDETTPSFSLEERTALLADADAVRLLAMKFRTAEQADYRVAHAVFKREYAPENKTAL